MKILALDLGQKRIGMAISEGMVIASMPVIEVDDRQGAIGKILEICRRENIQKIILGIPLKNKKNEDIVRSFALEFRKLIDISIEFEDETLTSKEAERLLKDLKVDPKSKKYKEEIDRISARLILEQYLKENI